MQEARAAVPAVAAPTEPVARASSTQAPGTAAPVARSAAARTPPAARARPPEGCGDGIKQPERHRGLRRRQHLPGDGATVPARSKTTGRVPPQGLARRKIKCGDGVIGRVRFATTATPLTTTAAIRPARFRTLPFIVSLQNPAPVSPSVTTRASKPARSATTATATAATAAAALVSSNPVGSARSRAHPASPLLAAAMGSQYLDRRSVRRRQYEGRRRLFRELQEQGSGVCLHTWSTLQVPDRQVRQRHPRRAASSATDGNTNPEMAARGPARSRPAMPVPFTNARAYPTAATAWCSSPWSNAIPA